MLPLQAAPAESVQFVLYVVLGTALNAAFGYVSSRRTKGEPFRPRRLAATIIVAVIIALLAWASGVTPTQDYILEQIVMFGGLVRFIEEGLKVVWPQYPGDSARSGASGSTPP